MVTKSIPTVAVSSDLKFDFGAGNLCLDFVNTVPVHPERGSLETHDDDDRLLGSYADLIEWSRLAGNIDGPTEERLLHNAAAGPDAAASALRRAIELREVIYRLIVAALDLRPAVRADLATFNAALRDARSRFELVQRSGEYAWSWKDLGAALDAPLAPILHAAATLMTAPHDLARVRRCSGEQCDWLFVDTSKNRSRRWCSMSGCGNRAKARRHYQRKRDAR